MPTLLLLQAAAEGGVLLRMVVTAMSDLQAVMLVRMMGVLETCAVLAAVAAVLFAVRQVVSHELMFPVSAAAAVVHCARGVAVAWMLLVQTKPEAEAACLTEILAVTQVAVVVGRLAFAMVAVAVAVHCALVAVALQRIFHWVVVAAALAIQMVVAAAALVIQMAAAAALALQMVAAVAADGT